MENKKLKPAKQALADAIHQNGGWPESELLDFATSNAFGEVLCSASHPERKGNVWVNGDYYRLIACIKGTIANWHKTVLSRDEYLTAYPEQVNVDVNNEAEHKVEVEMESESEATINASDWHKSGELPPVGEVVMLNSTNPNDYWAHHVGVELTVVAHDKDSRGADIAVYRFVDAGGYNEYHGLVAHAFLPLRTERDKAIDEMVCEFIDHNGDPKGGERYLGIAAKLYDAGYRKDVKQ